MIEIRDISAIDSSIRSPNGAPHNSEGRSPGKRPGNLGDHQNQSAVSAAHLVVAHRQESESGSLMSGSTFNQIESPTG